MEKENSSPSAKVLERQLSIEKEPRALFSDELKLAREAALEVIKNNTAEQALKIFLEGLEPVKISVKPQCEPEDFEEVDFSAIQLSLSDEVLSARGKL